ncbi:MAG: ArsR/SmtB family transcription factor [Candidatus Thorarchaeota archaeon]
MAVLRRLSEVFSALGNEGRLRILQAIKRGTSNPGELSRLLGLPRSTVEKNIRILARANLLEKKPGLSPKGQLRVYYQQTGLSALLMETAMRLFDEKTSYP